MLALQMFITGDYSLLLQFYLIEEIFCSAYTIDNKKNVSNINRNIAADSGVEFNITHCRAPRTVEIYSYKLSATVNNRRT